jgi:TnpA family transposase
MAEPAPEEIDPDQILNDWALDEADLREVMRARGPDSRLWTALHLCGLRRTGRFIDDPAQVPGSAVIHLARRLGEEPPGRLLLLPRPATDSAIRARVRDPLGFVPFSADARNRLEAALSEVAADGLALADLIQRAETARRAAKVILPARATLERRVASIARQALDALFNRLATRLPASLRVALDRLVGQLADDAGTAGRASLGRYRTPSAASMGRFTREARQRLEEIEALLAGLPDLADVPQRIRRQLAQLCRRYDGHALRGFPPDKRHGLLICFLLDWRQGLLDDLAQAHDNHMTGLMRRARHAAEAEARRLRRAAEDGLLMLVGFTRAFRPLAGYEPHARDTYRALLATLIAHGTNLGLTVMGDSVENLTATDLQQTSRWLVRDATLKAANAQVVEHLHRLDFAAVWGEGRLSSSDGQRFRAPPGTLIGAYNPRYFGHYDKAVTVYTHVSDRLGVFSTQLISCAPREATYVLDGLLENDTSLDPRLHTTDTHGFTESLWGLCHLLGIDFMPRLKDLADQRLWLLEGASIPAALAGLFAGTADAAVISEQWDQLVRIAASLKARTAPAHVVLQRLTAGGPDDRVAKALAALGRLVKTRNILRYLHDAPFRRRIQAQLNRGESRHALARWLFFANQGEFRTSDYEAMMNKASCLSLVSNTVVLWNTLRMARIVSDLRASGMTIANEDLAHVWPLQRRHVVPSGVYFVNRTMPAFVLPEPADT